MHIPIELPSRENHIKSELACLLEPLGKNVGTVAEP